MADNDIDLDPAAPEGTEALDQNTINAANYGLDGKGDLPPGAAEELKFQQLRAIAFNVANALAFLQQCLRGDASLHQPWKYFSRRIGSATRLGQKSRFCPRSEHIGCSEGRRRSYCVSSTNSEAQNRARRLGL